MATTTLPPGPPAHPLLGHLPGYQRDPLGFITRVAREHGDIVPLRFGIQMRVGPMRGGVLISHPDYIEQVLVTENQKYIKPIFIRGLAPLTGNGLLNSEGDFWLRQRRLIQPAFHRKRIATYAATMTDYAERRLATWRDGETRDIHHEMMALTLEIVAKTLFGAEVSDAVDEVGAALEVALEGLEAKYQSLMLFVPHAVPTPGHRRITAAVRRLDAIVYQIIDARRAEGATGDDLLSTLLRAQAEDGSRMTDQQLRDEVMTLFLAGHETTALALSWTWLLLAQRPEAEARLHAELAAALDGRAPAPDDMARLPYTEAVINESLRLYPPAWIISREARVDTEIGGYPIHAGQSVSMSQWVTHRDPRYFERPDDFVPERWLDGLAKRLPRFAYFPFGGGPRLCVGGAFATMEATLLLATIAQRYHLRLALDQPVVPSPAVTLRPRHGLRMTLTSRR